jgi:HPt (histidine-containing phosphotransfer) domain-containing protein
MDAATDPPVLDETTVKELIELGSGMSLLTELVDLFRVSVGAHLEDLDASIADGDYVSTGRTAHSISGASASIGAGRVVPLARRLEQLASQSCHDCAPGLAADIRRSIVEALAALDLEIRRGNSS